METEHYGEWVRQVKVTLLASTRLVERDHNLPWEEYNQLEGMQLDEWSTEADDLAEFAGRACYQSFHKPNPDTRSNRDYLANIVKAGHFSVLEHGSATFYVEGVSRNLTHELIRHRHLSFSELSQRFVDMNDYATVTPPAVPWLADTDAVPIKNRSSEYHNVMVGLADLPRKQAREAARYYLPAGMETKIVVTGNHRTWREVIQKRNRPEADAEIQLLAKELLVQLKGIAPNTYQDME